MWKNSQAKIQNEEKKQQQRWMVWWTQNANLHAGFEKSGLCGIFQFFFGGSMLWTFSDGVRIRWLSLYKVCISISVTYFELVMSTAIGMAKKSHIEDKEWLKQIDIETKRIVWKISK